MAVGRVRRTGRIPLREQIARNLAAQNLMNVNGKPPMPVPAMLAYLTEPKKPRAPRVASGNQSEADILRECIAALRKHPQVARVLRNQSGVFKDGDRYVTVGKKGLLDLTIYLKDGHYAELEIKSETGTLSPEQYKRICDIRADGGFADVARSATAACTLVTIWAGCNR